MRKEIQEACYDYEKILLDAAKYSGNKEKEKKIFSASMLGSEPLQNFLKFKYGVKESTKFEANTLGSIYQLGVDKAFEKYKRYKSAHRIEYTLSNGWVISGEIDQLDYLAKIIFDNKVTTATTIGKIKSEGKNHSYALQMGAYKMLLAKEAEALSKIPDKWTSVLPIVDKGFSYFKNNKFDNLTFVEVETYSIDEIESMFLDVTNELDKYIELDQEPGVCKDRWPYGRKGEAKKPMRCIHYCDVSEHCKYFDTLGKSAVNELLGL